MIARDMLPISFIDGEGFGAFMAFVEPEFTVPSRKTVTSRLEELHDNGASNLRTQLTSAEKVSLTDAWIAEMILQFLKLKRSGTYSDKP